MRISDWSSDVCSSDLRARSPCAARARGWPHRAAPRRPRCWLRGSLRILLAIMAVIAAEARAAGGERDGVEHQIDVRSEEHTSELQSLMRISYAVFCLKKKNINMTYHEKQQQRY